MSHSPTDGAPKSRRVVTRIADRVMNVAAERMRRSVTIDSPTRRRLVRGMAGWTASAAYVAKLWPRVEVVRLTGPRWPVTFVGDSYMRPQLERALFDEDPVREVVGRAAVWDLQRAVDQALADSPLVVCSLPQWFPARWRPTARLSFRTPVFVDHLLDLSVPLDVRLRGNDHKSLRQLLGRTRRAPITTRTTRAEQDIRRFHEELLAPFQRRRHGARAMVMSYASLAGRLRRPDFELVELLHDGQVVAGTLLRFTGKDGSIDEMGIADGVPEAIAKLLPAKILLVGIERSGARGCARCRFGGSLAFCSDPVFRAKRRWGVRTVPRDKLTHPEWTWLARSLPDPLARRIEDLGPLTFHEGRSCLVRLRDGDAAGEHLPPVEGLDGYLVVSPDEVRFVAAPSDVPSA